MTKRLKLFAIAAVAIVLVSTLIVYFANIDLPPKTQSTLPQYLSYGGNVSKIFLVASTVGYGEANETYTATDGQVVQKGSLLFVVTATLRNDYSSDNPPPPNGVPIAPADGTAYVYLTAQLNSKEGAVKAKDVTVPDFVIPSTSGAAIVLAAGQTAPVNIYMAVNQKDITDCIIKMIFIGDSIPT
jgi:hypothetical protein